jgi:hypothetical protein
MANEADRIRRKGGKNPTAERLKAERAALRTSDPSAYRAARSKDLRTGAAMVIIVATVIGFIVYSNARDSGNNEIPKQQTVTVPVSKTDPDNSYIIGSEAKVSNEDYGDAMYGYVVVRAKRGDDQGNRGPLLTGTVGLSDGSSVKCEKARSTVWSDFESFEDLDMKCSSSLDLKLVSSVTITG